MSTVQTTSTPSNGCGDEQTNENDDAGDELPYEPTLNRVQVADDLERHCPDCESELVYERNELVCTGCAYTPAVVHRPRPKRDAWEDLWEKRNRLSADTGPRRKRCIGGFERPWEDEYDL